MIKNLLGRVPDLSAVIKRFPVAVLVMGLFTLIWIFIPKYEIRNDIWRLLVGLVVGGYLCVFITVAREAANKPRLYLVQALIAAAIAVIFFFSESLRLNIAMAIGAVLLTLGSSIGWRQPRNDLKIWDFTHKIWTGAIMATVGSIIFMLGLLAIMQALKSLLGVNIRALVEELVMPIGFGFLAPLYWLSTVPLVDEDIEELYEKPSFISKAIGFLGTWLLAPLSLIYGVIILLYGVKILFAMELPKGEIAQLTTPFLMIGALTWLVLEPPFIQKNVLARWFRKLWFPLSIPVALLLAVAVFVRVQAYGLTQERYALILVVIWSLGLGLWFTLRNKASRDIRIVPGLAAALLVIGTFSALPLSLKSQTNRAQTIVANLGLLDGSDKTIPIENPTEEQTEQLRQLKTQISFLSRHKAKRALRSIFPNAQNVDKAKDLFEELQIETLAVHRRGPSSNTYFNDTEKTIYVDGFQTVKGAYAAYRIKSDNERVLADNDDGVRIILKAGTLSVIHADGHEVVSDLQTAVKKLKPYNQRPLIIDLDTRTRLQLTSLTLRPNADTDEVDITSMNFYVLLRD